MDDFIGEAFESSEEEEEGSDSSSVSPIAVKAPSPRKRGRKKVPGIPLDSDEEEDAVAAKAVVEGAKGAKNTAKMTASRAIINIPDSDSESEMSSPSAEASARKRARSDTGAAKVDDRIQALERITSGFLESDRQEAEQELALESRMVRAESTRMEEAERAAQAAAIGNMDVEIKVHLPRRTTAEAAVEIVTARKGDTVEAVWRKAWKGAHPRSRAAASGVTFVFKDVAVAGTATLLELAAVDWDVLTVDSDAARREREAEQKRHSEDARGAAAEADKMEVTLASATGEGWAVKVSPTTTIAQLKEHAKTHFKASKVNILDPDGDVLADGDTLADAGVEDGEQLDVVIAK